MLQRLALEQLHGDKRTTFELSNVVNGADIRMVESGCGARFAAESFDRLWVLGNVDRQKFQGDIAAEAGVLGFIDYAHPTAAKFFRDVIVGDGAANNGGSIRHRPRSLPQRLVASKRDGSERRHVAVVRSSTARIALQSFNMAPTEHVSYIIGPRFLMR